MNDKQERTKLDDMAARIRQAEKPVASAPDKAAPMKMSRVGFDFIGSVLGGLVLGWLTDKYLPNLAPWGMIVMILLGFGAGMMSVWRIQKSQDGSQ